MVIWNLSGAPIRDPIAYCYLDGHHVGQTDPGVAVIGPTLGVDGAVLRLTHLKAWITDGGHAPERFNDIQIKFYFFDGIGRRWKQDLDGKRAISPDDETGFAERPGR